MPAKPIKIVHVLAVEKEAFYFNNLVDLSDRNEYVHAFANFAGPSEFADTMRRRGLSITNLGALNKKRLPLAFFRLWRCLRIEDPEIVHTHLFDPTFLGLLAAKMQGRNTVVTRHHSDAVHVLEPRIKRKFYLGLEHQNNRKADHIIALSKTVRDIVVEREGVPAKKVSLIPNPQTSERYDRITDVAIAQKRRELGMDEQLSLVCVSRLYNRKGHVYLFEALAPLIGEGLKVKLYLVGSGDFRSQLETRARDLGINDNVEFLGYRDDALEIIAAADLIVHPSLEDALSQALIESLMLAKPIIATDISGARDILDDGKYGTLVMPADPAALRTAVSDAIRNMDQASERAKSGREYLLEYMDAQRVADEYGAIYQKVLRRKKNPS
jgi:glycosyltransferase involved in cell wall biosynthesis